ncbi:replication endonuclease [Comamonas koreensis]|uniref:Replication endonuclease n=1 Tax=Comamonas koreensis TaxID=160825 RepID=A0AAW4XRQ2_9BURK|nr:replication endonuclease [Comamonas koreensis]MCD2163830.1 replication endonuclease [Comamonas koreensis]
MASIESIRSALERRSPIERVEAPWNGAHDWLNKRPTHYQADVHLERIVKAAPAAWRASIRARFGRMVPPAGLVLGSDALARWELQQLPEGYAAWDRLQGLATWQDEYGQAVRLNMGDREICAWADKMVADVGELDAMLCHAGADEAQRVDLVRKIARLTGIREDKPIQGMGAINRAKCPKWWRRKLRRLVARVVEGGYIAHGQVHLNSGGYVSHSALMRRKHQNARNADILEQIGLRNEAGQVFKLSTLAALSTANPAIRGGELMTRIRGTEEYADEKAHVGLFFTMTLPSRFHRMTLVGGSKKAIPNDKWNGAGPREGQAWLCKQWSKARAALTRAGIRFYGLRVAEPHHDGTPHWHMLAWVDSEADARAMEGIIRKYWLSEDGKERGAQEHRVRLKRIEGGGAAGYVAKYIAKNVGNHALSDHLDVVNGQEATMRMQGDGQGDQLPAKDTTSSDYAGYKRVDAWASHWGVRQFQAFGLPSVTVWREMRRVTEDQVQAFQAQGDWATWTIHYHCHRRHNLRADWCVFMKKMGGHCLKRGQWYLRVARSVPMDGQTNSYGEPLKVGRIMGLEPQHGRMCGRVLVSRRMFWQPLASGDASIVVHAAAPDSTNAAPSLNGAKPWRTIEEQRALPAAWTGFINCTGRLTNNLRRSVFGDGCHDGRAWSYLQSPSYAEKCAAEFEAERQNAIAEHTRALKSQIFADGWENYAEDCATERERMRAYVVSDWDEEETEDEEVGRV